MNYDAPQIDGLAAEYVLGTLQSSARQRFEGLMAERGDVRAAVWRWERHLNGMIVGVQPQKLPNRIWKNIQHRIGSVSRERSESKQWWWRLGMALPAAIAIAWFAFLLPPTPDADRMAVFSDQNAAALWIVSMDLDERVMHTETVHAEASAADSSYELWVLPAEGPPQSLGLLTAQSGTTETAISIQLASALETAGGLAISLEPQGGSPTGLPTGPIVYQASLIII